MVVSRNWSAFISPRPLKRWSETPFAATSMTVRRRSSNDSASSVSLPSLTVNGGVPASFTSSPCTRASCRYSLSSNSDRRRRCVRARLVFRSTARMRMMPSVAGSSSVV